MTQFFGETESERLARDNTVARQIVKEINQFGINDRQRWIILHLLSLELENVDEMKSMSSFISETKGKDIFVSRVFSNETAEESET